jgi:hypothetical protein
MRVAVAQPPTISAAAARLRQRHADQVAEIVEPDQGDPVGAAGLGVALMADKVDLPERTIRRFVGTAGRAPRRAARAARGQRGGARRPGRGASPPDPIGLSVFSSIVRHQPDRAVKSSPRSWRMAAPSRIPV